MKQNSYESNLYRENDFLKDVLVCIPSSGILENILLDNVKDEIDFLNNNIATILNKILYVN